MSNHSNDYHGKVNSAKKDDIAGKESDTYGSAGEEDNSFSSEESKRQRKLEEDVPEVTENVENRELDTDESSDMGFSEEDFAELSEAERILDERNLYLDSLQRLQADFDNFRKRSSRQQAESKELAHAQLIEKLLPVLDAFELAVSHIDNGLPQTDDPEEPPQNENTSSNANSDNGEKESSTLKSFIQIRSLLEDTLAKEGLIRIGSAGEKFNPSYHDAVSHEPTDSAEEAGIIIDVFRSGYKLKDRVLRPAMVKVKG